ncbi:9155_t:CDS:2, partial [Acaulospora morrowiae]
MTEETQPTKSRKPGGSSIKQQKLWACQPIITPKTVFPLFFGIAIIFTPLGGLLLYYSETVNALIYVI